jgi:hypothetical protein
MIAISVPTFDLVPCLFKGLHDCLRLSDRNEGVNALSRLADVLREGASDYSSNRCFLSTNIHGATRSANSFNGQACAKRIQHRPDQAALLGLRLL